MDKYEYKIEGLILTTIKCSPKNAMDFTEKYYNCTDAIKKAELAKSILVPKKGSEEDFEKINFVDDVDMDDIEKVLSDFFFRSTRRTPEEMNSLILSYMKEKGISNSTSGLKNS